MSLDQYGGSILKDIGLVPEVTEEQRINAARVVQLYTERADIIEDLETLLEMLDLM